MSCKSNQDPVPITNIACSTLIGRSYTYWFDYLLYDEAGKFTATAHMISRGCQVLVELNIDSYSTNRKLRLANYETTSDEDQSQDKTFCCHFTCELKSRTLVIRVPTNNIQLAHGKLSLGSTSTRLRLIISVSHMFPSPKKGLSW